MNSVKAWKDRIVIPTYEIGQPEKYPVFLEKRVYQGSSGSVYPYPVIESVSKEKTDKEWEVVYLENRYLKIMILPALGGRVQMAYDKIRERHFIYHNSVIKPALVGLTGPWISGGIEFNWPQHHRPSTYQPVDYRIEAHEDGSQTVWVSEVERMFRTKGMAGFRLYPDKAYLEINVQLYNRTPHPQTFLWWANPAVSVNDHYQSVFPPDVHAVFDHGKRDVSGFPIAKGTYYKVDYLPGTDISRYKNIPVPTSYMAITSDYDFVGGYENDSKGGVLHVANHHVSPGKKQWTWGNGDFGRAWDRNLTDKDGPYIELMCGVYTDNQPDFSWLQPYEEKSFSQYFMPYHNVGVVKNATKEAMVNLETDGQKARIRVHVTAEYPASRILLIHGQNILFNEKIDLSPADVFDQTIRVEPDQEEDLEVLVLDRFKRTLVQWKKQKMEDRPVPEAAKPARQPKEIETNEQLYLRGLHLEQYRHATYNPTDYYKEALRRDPGDVRNNNALGLWLLKKGQFEAAKTHFEKAIETLTERNPNPYDGEPFFNLGLACKFLGQLEEAYGAFYKSCWNAAWQDAGYYQVALLDCRKGDYATALEHIEKALIRNSRHHQALHLKVVLLRKLKSTEKALAVANQALEVDGFNYGVLYEKYLLTTKKDVKAQLLELMRGDIHTYLEYALDYAHAGFYEEAIDWLSDVSKSDDPIVHYFLGWFNQQAGNIEDSNNHFKKATQFSPDFCFPNRLEDILALQAAIASNPDDHWALALLGNFWYAARQYDEAIECWERSIAVNKQNPLAYKNLALAYYNKLGKKEEALKLLETAFSLDPTSARILMELDQLYKKMNKAPEERLQVLEDHLDLVEQRDDLCLELATLLNIQGKHDRALDLIMSRQFQPWEGGEGKVPAQYIFAHVELAKQAIGRRNFETAIEHLKQAQVYPHNLGEGKLYGAQENDIFYWMGVAYDGLDNKSEAENCWKAGAKGNSDPSPAIFYNDAQPDKIFYQGLCALKLGNERDAKDRFEKLVSYGKTHINDQIRIDYFAVSLPDLLIWEEDLNLRNQIHCNYLIALGNIGLGEMERASALLQQIQAVDYFHLGAHLHKNFISNPYHSKQWNT